MGVTAAIVLMLSLTGVAPKFLIQARAIETLIGGVLALSAYAIWPTWEPVEGALADLLAAYREYFRAVAQRYLGSPAAEALVSRERLAARMARSNLEASIERLAAEPSTETNHIELVRSMIASSHRFVHAIMALEAGEPKNTATLPRPNCNDLSQTSKQHCRVWSVCFMESRPAQPKCRTYETIFACCSKQTTNTSIRTPSKPSKATPS
jgi:uncharacterized membrane protein YccC